MFIQSTPLYMTLNSSPYLTQISSMAEIIYTPENQEAETTSNVPLLQLAATIDSRSGSLKTVLAGAGVP